MQNYKLIIFENRRYGPLWFVRAMPQIGILFLSKKCKEAKSRIHICSKKDEAKDGKEMKNFSFMIFTLRFIGGTMRTEGVYRKIFHVDEVIYKDGTGIEFYSEVESFLNMLQQHRPAKLTSYIEIRARLKTNKTGEDSLQFSFVNTLSGKHLRIIWRYGEK